MDAQSQRRDDRGLTLGQRTVERWATKQHLTRPEIKILKHRYWGGVFFLKSECGARFVCKTGGRDYDAACESEMLTRLKHAGLNVPSPIHVQDGLLVMNAMSVRPLNATTTFQAGQQLALLHVNSASHKSGYPYSTNFGAIKLSNVWQSDWCVFFVEQRLIAFTEEAKRLARIDEATEHRVRRVAERLSTYLSNTEHISLLHGDIWSNNVIVGDDRPAFLDPAAFYGDADYDVAFLASYMDMRLHALKGYETYRKLDTHFWNIKFPIYRLAFDIAHLALFGAPFEKATRKRLDILENRL